MDYSNFKDLKAFFKALMEGHFRKSTETSATTIINGQRTPVNKAHCLELLKDRFPELKGMEDSELINYLLQPKNLSQVLGSFSVIEQKELAETLEPATQEAPVGGAQPQQPEQEIPQQAGNAPIPNLPAATSSYRPREVHNIPRAPEKPKETFVVTNSSGKIMEERVIGGGKLPAKETPKIQVAGKGGVVKPDESKLFISKGGTITEHPIKNLGSNFSSRAQIGLKRLGTRLGSAATSGLGGAIGGGGRFLGRVGMGGVNAFGRLSNEVGRGRSFAGKAAKKRWILLLFGGIFMFTVLIGTIGAGPNPGGITPPVGPPPVGRPPIYTPPSGCVASSEIPPTLDEFSYPERDSSGGVTTCGPTSGTMVLQSAGIKEATIAKVATAWQSETPPAWTRAGYSSDASVIAGALNKEYPGRIKADGVQNVGSADAIANLIQQTHNPVMVSAYYDNNAKAHGLDKQEIIGTSKGGISLSKNIGHMIAVWQVCTDRVFINDPVLGEQYSIPKSQFNTAITVDNSRGESIYVTSLNRTSPPPGSIGFSLSCPIGENPRMTCGTYTNPVNGGFGLCGHGLPPNYPTPCDPKEYICIGDKYTEGLYHAVDVTKESQVKLPSINGQSVEWTKTGVDNGTGNCTPGKEFFISTKSGWRVTYTTTYQGKTICIDLAHLNNNVNPADKLNSGDVVATIFPTANHLHTAVQVDGRWIEPQEANYCSGRIP